MWVFGNFYQQHYPEQVVSTWLICQILSWLPQFAAHKWIEGRAPALLDNLAQAFLLAPFFVFLEVLFKFGYRPQLRKEIEHSVEQNVSEWKRASAKKTQ